MLVWDATCVHRLAPTYINTGMSKGAVVAELAETRKTTKYAGMTEQFDFQPVAVESLGGLGRHSLNFIKQLGSRIAEATGESEATQQLRQRLSIAVQIGNAACILESFNRFV
jgi:hypothetical protein